MVSDPSSVTVGIDAAVVAKHRVVVRGSGGVEERFSVPPTLAGLGTLTERLSSYRGALTVAEPTAMSWLALGHAVTDAGCGFALVETRHTARLRGAISGRNETERHRRFDAGRFGGPVRLVGRGVAGPRSGGFTAGGSASPSDHG